MSRTPTVVPKEVYEAQSPEVRDLLNEWRALHSKPKKTGLDRAALRKIRAALRASGFNLSEVDLRLQVREMLASKRAKEPEEDTITTTFKLTKKLHRRLSFAVIDADTTASEIVQRALTEYLDREGIPSRLKRER